MSGKKGLKMLFKGAFYIKCGEDTCQSKRGKFCKHFRTHLGKGNYCHFFNKFLDSEDNKILRCKKCLKKFNLTEDQVGYL